MAWEQWIDNYRRTARLSPALLVALPLIVLVLVAVPAVLSWWAKSVGVVVVSGLPFVIMQLVRDRGRQVEQKLFQSWSGAPTTTLLRWAGPESRAAVNRRHALLGKVTGVRLPTLKAEEVDPRRADEVYDVATAALRELTRDNSRFELLHHELKTYGFRRNVYGCRALGIAISITAAVVTPVFAWARVIPLDWKAQAALTLFDGLWVLWWWRICTPGWVRQAANNYARQLFASLEALDK